MEGWKYNIPDVSFEDDCVCMHVDERIFCSKLIERRHRDKACRAVVSALLGSAWSEPDSF